MWTCQRCGISNSDNANYCSNCGNKKTLTNHVGERASNNALGASTTRNILIISVTCLTLLSILLIFHIKHNSQNNRVSAQDGAQITETIQSAGFNLSDQTQTTNVGPASSDGPLSTGNLKTVAVGDVVNLGKYEQSGSITDGEEAIEWIVLEKRDDRILVISRYILERIVYDSQGGLYAPAWDDSAVCLWLNSAFYQNAFSDEEKSLIETVTVTNEIRDAQNKVFILNAPEARKYFTSDSSRIAEPTGFIKANNNWTAWRAWESDDYEELSEYGRSAWLLRAEGSFADCAAYIDGNGDICEAYGNGLNEYINGVRPAMWLHIR